MTVSDFFLKLLYFNKMEQERLKGFEAIIRAQTHFLLQIQSKSTIDMNKLWPLEEQEVKEAKYDLSKVNEVIKKVWG
jgi:hypothetical protein